MFLDHMLLQEIDEYLLDHGLEPNNVLKEIRKRIQEVPARLHETWNSIYDVVAWNRVVGWLERDKYEREFPLSILDRVLLLFLLEI